jgi:hypothetical protein
MLSIHYKYNIWSHECVILDINTIKLNHVFTRLLHWNTFNLMPYKAHTQQWALKIAYRHNTNGVAFTRTVQIIGPLSTDTWEGLHTHACAHIHTNNKFNCTGELKIPTLPTPNPKVHGPTSNNPNFFEIPEHCPLTWNETSPMLVIFRHYCVHVAHCQDIYLNYTTAVSFKIVQLSLNAIKAENLSESQNRPHIIVLPLSRGAKKLSRPILYNIHNSVFIHACYMSRTCLEFFPNRNTSFKLCIREQP